MFFWGVEFCVLNKCLCKLCDIWKSWLGPGLKGWKNGMLLSQTTSLCYIQSVSVTDSLCLSQTVCVCHRQSMSVTDNLCLSQAVCVCHRHTSWSFLVWFLLIYTWFLQRFVREIFICLAFKHHQHQLCGPLVDTWQVRGGESFLKMSAH